MEEQRLRDYFADAYPTVARFTELLADEGVLRGLIGPREVPRLWERHILNSAAVTPFIPAHGTLVDVGTGAGLPGVVVAAMRPELDVVLLEPMARRTAWLDEVVATLGLARVEVVRGRAEDLHGERVFDVVTARAVAPMDRLAGWTLPLLSTGGVLLAMKGRSAHEELAAAANVLRRLGGDEGRVLEATTLDGLESTTVVRVERVRDGARPATSMPARGRNRRR